MIDNPTEAINIAIAVLFVIVCIGIPFQVVALVQMVRELRNGR